jgi:transglutaminase-like putative cysteine protease
MSRLLKLLSGRLFPFALTAFIAYSLCLPLLNAMGIKQEQVMAVLYALAASALISLYGLVRPRLKFLVPLFVLAGLVLSVVFLKGSAPARVFAFVRSLASGASPPQALTLYMDALLPFLLFLLALFARLLMEGDPAFTLPLMVAPVLLMWFLGARENIRVYFPAVLCLPLLYVYISHTTEVSPLISRPRTLVLRALALALALAFLASALTPDYRRTLPQAEQMADEIRRRMEDLFFFTATRNMFALSSQGYQPMGEGGLGGSPNISQAPVMNVQSLERIYLRGTALDTYTGRSWYDSLSNERYGWQSVRFSSLRSDLFNEELPGNERVESRQATITMLSKMPSTLFVPQRLRDLALGPDMVAYFNASSELFITRDLENGDHYTIRYEPYVAGDARTDTLAAKLAADGLDASPELPEEYTKLPNHLQPDGAIAGFAREIAGQETSPYRQAQALMRYLKANYTYSTDVPDAPENQDFAAHFLFDQPEGYCTYFATAMTVLARSLGLPARYVEGFLADPDGASSVTLTGMNAHAWTEIHIAGLGWVIFDATAADGEGGEQEGDQPPDGRQSPPSPSPSPSPSPEPSEQPSEEPTQEPQDAPTPTPPPGEEPSPEPSAQPEPDTQDQGQQEPDKPFPWWVLLAMAFLALTVWRVIEEAPERRERRLHKPEEVLNLYWQAMLAARKAGGQGMLPQETPLSYADRLGQGTPGLPALALAQSAWIYGRTAPDAQALDLAKTQYQAAWRQLPWYQKALLALRRGITMSLKAAAGLPGILYKKARSLLQRR